MDMVSGKHRPTHVSRWMAVQHPLPSETNSLSKLAAIFLALHCNACAYTQQNITVQHAPRRVRNHEPIVQLTKYLRNLEYEH
jgi:hypothetical protein